VAKRTAIGQRPPDAPLVARKGGALIAVAANAQYWL
jgi:hypothetical protein